MDSGSRFGITAERIPIDQCICEGKVSGPRRNCWATTHDLKAGPARFARVIDDPAVAAQVVSLAAAFPQHNADNPVPLHLVVSTFPVETEGFDGRRLAAEVVKLIDERPADPFAGICS